MPAMMTSGAINTSRLLQRSPGGARATGVEKKSARMMSELRIVDSLDGQLLGQAVDLKTGETRQDEGEGIQLADVVPILEQWSTRAVERVRGLRSKVKKENQR